MTKKRVLLIVGPTGIGKTSLSLELSKKIDIEIVSADSRQVYRFMDIGTAKPTKQELAAVPHHFIDIRNPDEYYSAGEFAKEARNQISEIFFRKKLPVVVGGSGLYIRALVDGLFEPKIADAETKRSLRKEAEKRGVSVLYDRLKEVDPQTAQSLTPTDSQRIMRALEVYELSGRPFSWFLRHKPKPADFIPTFIGLNLPRKCLYARIEKRVDLMFEQGLLDEVRRLQKMGYGPELNALQTVGYKEVFSHFSGKLDFTETVTLIKQKSRNYAKRQMTWFKKDERIHWVDLNLYNEISEVTAKILEIFYMT